MKMEAKFEKVVYNIVDNFIDKVSSTCLEDKEKLWKIWREMFAFPVKPEVKPAAPQETPIVKATGVAAPAQPEKKVSRVKKMVEPVKTEPVIEKVEEPIKTETIVEKVEEPIKTEPIEEPVKTEPVKEVSPAKEKKCCNVVLTRGPRKGEECGNPISTKSPESGKCTTHLK